MPFVLVEQLARELAHRGVRDGPRQVTVLHHPSDVQVLDDDDLASVHQGPGSLVDQVSSGVGDLWTPEWFWPGPDWLPSATLALASVLSPPRSSQRKRRSRRRRRQGR